MIPREGWKQEERRRVRDGLREARFWLYVEPQSFDFWEIFWGEMMEVQYPEWKWCKQRQAGLDEFTS